METKMHRDSNVGKGIGMFMGGMILSIFSLMKFSFNDILIDGGSSAQIASYGCSIFFLLGGLDTLYITLKNHIK